MSYTIYSTDGFIIEQKASKDADISLLIFTESFGLIFAVATGARYLKSKLRYSLQSLSFSNISLVKGREVWRVTSAKKLISLYDRRLPIEYRTLHARILSAIARFCPREQEEKKVFELLRSVAKMTFTKEKGDMQVQSIELLFMLNLLYHLGYIVKNENALLEPYIGQEISLEALELVASHQQEVEKLVARAISESHL